MASPVSICNIALAECGNRVQINSFSDGTPASQIAGLLYTQKVQTLMRAAPWDSLRAQLPLTQIKAAVINGAVSINPPPQPWQVEYAWPPDCLRLRFIQPTLNTAPAGTPLTTAPNVVLYAPPVPTAIPFVVSTDFDGGNNPIKVVLANLYGAQGIYTRDLSQFPDLWDSLFTTAVTAMLASYFINALSRNKDQMQAQITLAKSALDQARAMNGNESISNIDHQPDWMRVRQTSAVNWAWNTGGPGGVYNSWDAMDFPGGLTY